MSTQPIDINKLTDEVLRHTSKKKYMVEIMFNFYQPHNVLPIKNRFSHSH